MKFFILILFGLSISKAKADAVTRAAFKYSSQAIFSYPETKKMRKNAETHFYSFLPIKRDKAALIGGAMMVAYTGRISTRNFKNMSVGVMGWNVSPELSLNTKNGETFALISINKQF